MALGGLEKAIIDVITWGGFGGLVCSTVTAVFKNGIKGTRTGYDSRAIVGGAIVGAASVPTVLIPQGLYTGKIFPQGLIAAKAYALATGAIFSAGKKIFNEAYTTCNQDKQISAFDFGVGVLIGALAMMRYVSSHGQLDPSAIAEITATSVGIATVLGFVYHHTWYPMTVALDPLTRHFRRNKNRDYYAP